MKLISKRKGFECDHSTRDYGYISGVKVFYDYGTFDMVFEIPYNTELFEILKKFKSFSAEKKFNKILINIRLWCEDFNEDESKHAELALEIRKEIIKKNMEILKLLDLYHKESEKYEQLKPETKLGKRLKKILSM